MGLYGVSVFGGNARQGRAASPMPHGVTMVSGREVDRSLEGKAIKKIMETIGSIGFRPEIFAAGLGRMSLPLQQAFVECICHYYNYLGEMHSRGLWDCDEEKEFLRIGADIDRYLNP